MKGVVTVKALGHTRKLEFKSARLLGVFRTTSAKCMNIFGFRKEAAQNRKQRQI